MADPMQECIQLKMKRWRRVQMGEKEQLKLATPMNMQVTIKKRKIKTKLCFHRVVLWHDWVYNIVYAQGYNNNKKNDIQATGRNMYRNTL